MTDRIPSLDPRVARSQDLLRDALLSLTLERGWDGVSVQQICRRAGVGRSTFYVHFADREDLLLGAFQPEHIARRLPHRNAPLAFVRPLVEHVGQHRPLYNVLVGTSCERAVRRRFLQVLSDMVEADLASRAAASVQRTTAVRFLTGAYFETLTFWLGGPNPAPASEIERMLRQFSAPVIERLRCP